MTASPINSSRRTSTRGFSLAEMLIVITIISFLLAMSAPNLFSLMRSSELSTQGDIFRNQLSLAQQMALSTNADVEVRFFKFADADYGQIKDEFQAMQFYQYDLKGVLEEKSPLLRLNAPVIFSGDQKYSNVLDRGGEDDNKDGLQALARPQEKFGNGVQRATYQAFRFHPDGSTDLPKDKTIWHITMMPDQGGDPKNPQNFYCLQIDPYNGSLRAYRP